MSKRFRQLSPIIVFLSIWMMLFSPIHAQTSTPIDVFISHNRSNQQVRVSFTNAVTGLSTVTTINNVAQDRYILDDFQISANGVIFRDPATSLPRLITPNGSNISIAFIPQRPANLLVDWVISDDGRTIAWAEIYFEGTVWQASLYVSRLDGTNLRQLPALPEKSSVDTTRVAMLAVSNDGNRVFFDMEHPTAPRRNTDYFLSYRSIWVYVEQQRSYRPLLPQESTNCPCPASVIQSGEILVELEPPILGNGFAVRVWNLENNRTRSVAAIDNIYTQAGDIIAYSGGTQVNTILYTLGGVEGATADDSAVFALVIADLQAGQQRIMPLPSGQRLVPITFTNQGREAIIVDALGNTTYKFNLATGNLDLVADQIWLGTLAG